MIHLSCVKDSSSNSNIKNILVSIFANLIYYFLCLSNNTESVFMLFSYCILIKVKLCSFLLMIWILPNVLCVIYCIMTYYHFQAFFTCYLFLCTLYMSCFCIFNTFSAVVLYIFYEDISKYLLHLIDNWLQIYVVI